MSYSTAHSYAIRKEFFTPLRDDDINDFVNPLQIIARGYRGRYELDTICPERAVGTYEGEFRRTVRTVNRRMRALWRVPSVMNPLRHGLFSLHVISHKLLRWFAAFFMFAALATSGRKNLTGLLWQPARNMDFQKLRLRGRIGDGKVFGR